MPFSRITTNFPFEDQLEFVNQFQKIIVDVLKIPAVDRLVVLDIKTAEMYVPNESPGKYMLFEIQMFAGRTLVTKKKLYKELFTLAKNLEVEDNNVNVILKDIDKQNWGIQGGQPASEVDLGFATNI